MDIMEQKRSAAKYSLSFIPRSGIVGIGTGSTVKYLIDLIGENTDYYREVTFVPTSIQTEYLLREYGLNVTVSFKGKMLLDIDGADEIDTQGNLIKGGGGALTREKIVAYNSEEFIVIADSGKYVSQLGKFKLPIEILPFLADQTIENIRNLGASVQLKDSGSFVTDNGNLIAIADFGMMKDPASVARSLSVIPGIVENGLFINMTTRAIEGTEASIREHVYFRKNGE
jgi:ribose 5-phosphate isomerase A